MQQLGFIGPATRPTPVLPSMQARSPDRRRHGRFQMIPVVHIAVEARRRGMFELAIEPAVRLAVTPLQMPLCR